MTKSKERDLGPMDYKPSCFETEANDLISLGKVTPILSSRENFVPGGIHSPDVAQFWREELNANDWVLETISSGYSMPLTGIPTIYEEENNSSAKKHIEFVRKTLIEWEKIGVVSFVQDTPTCVSPLTVSERSDGKLRLCLDASRHVNKFLEKKKVTLEHLQRALDVTEAGDYQTKYDLKSAYFHIKIVENQRQYLGIAFTNQEGEKQYAIFNCLPFGMGSAVHCITKIFKPLNAYFHSKGIRHTIFIDDGRALSRSKEQGEEDRIFIYQTLANAGWTIELKKSDKKGEASQSKEYLGFIIDTKAMTVSLTPNKKASLKLIVEETIQAVKTKVRVKTLAKCAGKMISAEPALGKLPIIAARPIYAEMEPVVETKGWNISISVTPSVEQSLSWFITNLEEFDHSPIKTCGNQMTVLSIIGPPSDHIKRQVFPNHKTFGDSEIWASDASAFAVCAYTVRSEEKVYFRSLLTNSEKELSSGHRELLTVKKTLEFYKQNFGPKSELTTVYWLTDSENLTSFIQKGSGKPHIQRDVFEILSLAKTLNFRIEPIHLLRSDPRIQIADQGSKVSDTDNWSLDATTFQQLQRGWDFTVDLFANDYNAKCRKFYSNFWSVHSSGIDAFAHDWTNERAWICPPVKKIVEVIKRLRIDKLEAVLIVPEWKTADFWPMLFGRKGELLWPFKKFTQIKPFIVSNEDVPVFPMAGYTSFNFLALICITN